MRRLAAGLALFAGAALALAASAEAFTVEPVSPNGSGGNQQLADPGELAPMQRFTTQPDGTSAYKFGDSGFSFSITGGRSSFPSSTYLDPSRPPQWAPYGLGPAPFGSYPR